jgi:hypothetical protein
MTTLDDSLLSLDVKQTLRAHSLSYGTNSILLLRCGVERIRHRISRNTHAEDIIMAGAVEEETEQDLHDEDLILGVKLKDRSPFSGTTNGITCPVHPN